MNWEASRKSHRSSDSFGAIPWWSYSCTYFLDQVIPKEWTVLELGGGASTEWWSRRGNSVTTLETSSAWAKELSARLAKGGLKSEIVEISEFTEPALDEIIGDRMFDVVVNDGDGDRNLIAFSLLRYVNPDGTYIWDNSDREEYSDSLDRFEEFGWKNLKFFGLAPINAYAGETTVFSRRAFSPLNEKPKFNKIKN